MKKFALDKMLDSLKDASPDILVGLGIIGLIGATVMACRSTRKADEILEETKETLDDIRSDEEMDDKEKRKEITVTYAKAGFKLAKVYGPSALLGLGSCGCILKSHGDLKTQKLSLMAQCANVSNILKSYRGNVVERFGEDVDKELRLGVHTEKMDDIVEVDGRKKKIKKDILVARDKQPGVYYFSDSKFYMGLQDYDESFIRSRQATMNERFHTNGILYLKDVLVTLGFEGDVVDETKHPELMVCGWLKYDEDCDGFIDFRCKRVYRDTVDKDTGEIIRILDYAFDFNHDGNMHVRLLHK